MYINIQKALSVVFLLNISNLLIAQDTTYYDGNSNEVNSKALAQSYTVITHDLADTNRTVSRSYTINGVQTSEMMYYMDNKTKKRDGICRSWHENGQLKDSIQYKLGNHDGYLLTYHSNGKRKRVERYIDNKMQEGNCYDISGNDTLYFEYEQLPVFPGDLYAYLGKEIRYPAKSREKNIQGKVVLSFIVNKAGMVEDVRIKKSVSEDIDNEALRVISEMPAWKPALQDGVPVRLRYTLPINFRLE